MKKEPGCRLSSKPTKQCSPRGDTKPCTPKPNIMNRRNAVGKIIPPVAIFKGKSYRSEFADSFPSGTSLWFVLEILYKRKIHRFFIFNLVFRNVTKELNRIICVNRLMLLVRTGTYWFWEPREFLNTCLLRHVNYRRMSWYVQELQLEIKERM